MLALFATVASQHFPSKRPQRRQHLINKVALIRIVDVFRSVLSFQESCDAFSDNHSTASVLLALLDSPFNTFPTLFKVQRLSWACLKQAGKTTFFLLDHFSEQHNVLCLRIHEPCRGNFLQPLVQRGGLFFLFGGRRFRAMQN